MKREYVLKLTAFIAIVAVLSALFWYGGNAPSLRGWNVEATIQPVNTREVVEVDMSAYESPTELTESSPKPLPSPTAKATPVSSPNLAKTGDVEYSRDNGMEISEEKGTDEYKTEPVPEGRPIPVEPDEVEKTDKEFKCTISVRCDTVLNNMSWLNKEKHSIIPSDGVILAEREVIAYEGESVFNVLLREMKKNKIHMEFVSTPIYNSAYIEGIANIYEFDCGELSGWIYKVNGWAPNYGCSRYVLKPGDKIEWVYSCNKGLDVGSYFAEGETQRDE